MKRQFLAIPLLLLLYSFIFSSNALAVCDPITGAGCCDSVTGIGCTVCYFDPIEKCRVDFNLSQCIDATVPDSTKCTTCITSGIAGDCIQAAVCDNKGDSCTGSGQGTCCNGLGLICKSNICTIPDVCKNKTEKCPGPVGTQGGCCEDLVCNTTKTGDRCQDPPDPPDGYNCNMAGSPCLPCYEGDECEYTTLGACTPACNGTVPLKYSCKSGACNESGTGSYTDLAACTSECEVGVSVSRFCNGKDETDGINTALGCIKVGSGQDLVVTILRLATGVGGGLALALILYGTFIVTTSAGMPDKLKAGGEIITSAIIGLIFILLSIFLVNLIGINILGIPGLV